jgi:nitrous oxidase accessory protein NosD
MRRLAIVAAALVLVAVLPASAHPRDSQSLATLEARVTALEARVAALEAGPTPSGPAPTPAPTVAPTPVVTAPPSGCTVTATGSIQAAIDATPDGGTVCLEPREYVLSGTVTLLNRTDLTVDGKGATVRANGYWTASAEILIARGGSGITFRDLVIVGTDTQPGYQPGPEFQAGIAFFGTQGATATGNTIRDTLGDGIGGYGGVTDLVVTGNTIERAGRWGVTLTTAERVTIAGNTVTDTDKAFELEPDLSSQAIRDVVIRDNIVNGGWNLLALYGPGTFANITVERNHGTGSHGIWSYVEPTGRASNVTFRDNRGDIPFWEDPCSTPCRAVLRIYRTDGATVTGNVQPVTSGAMAGVLSEDSTGIAVSGNDFPGATVEHEQR